MITLGRISTLWFAAMACAASFSATAQSAYPDRPVRVVVAIPAGGSVDMVARLVSDKLGQELGKSFVVDNRGGASGFIGMSFAAKAPADGYTLVVGPAAFMATNKSVFKSMPYDPEKDFAPISKLVNQSMVMVVRSNSPLGSVRQVIAEAKANPGKLTYASAGDGSPHHLSAVLFEKAASVKLTHVPYKGGGPAMTDLLAGTVDVLFAGLPEALPHLKSGRLKALALLSDKRSGAAPEIQTAAEAGLGNLTLSAWMALFAPAGTPAPIIQQLHRAVEKVMAGDARARLLEVGLDPAPTTPQELKTLVADEIRQHADLVRSAGIQPQ